MSVETVKAVCKDCGIEKFVSEFRKNTQVCKECIKQKTQKTKETNAKLSPEGKEPVTGNGAPSATTLPHVASTKVVANTPDTPQISIGRKAALNQVNMLYDTLESGSTSAEVHAQIIKLIRLVTKTTV